jgi:signal-transduction protein with cAMP-binding, CBS, and nucleotidyltransferase domain
MKKSFFILGHLSDENVEWIAANGVHRVVASGETIITMGVPCESVFFLLDGEMSVTISGIGEIARLKSIDIIGEMSLVDAQSVPSATVTATGESVVLEISKSLIQEKMVKDIGFAANFYHAVAIFLSDRLRAQYMGTAVKRS